MLGGAGFSLFMNILPIAEAMMAGALAMAVALGTSMTFLTSLGHPVNVLVMSAGGYKFGAPLTALLFVLVLVLLPVFWPLR